MTGSSLILATDDPVIEDCKLPNGSRRERAADEKDQRHGASIRNGIDTRIIDKVGDAAVGVECTDWRPFLFGFDAQIDDREIADCVRRVTIGSSGRASRRLQAAPHRHLQRPRAFRPGLRRFDRCNDLYRGIISRAVIGSVIISMIPSGQRDGASVRMRRHPFIELGLAGRLRCGGGRASNARENGAKEQE